MNKKITAVVVAAAFIVGGGFGAAGASGEGAAQIKTVSSVPLPAVTVTVPGPERIVTKTVEVPGPATNETPKACLDALDAADDGFRLAGDGMTAASEGFMAISNSDLAGLEASANKISAAGAELEGVAPRYKTAREACRSTSSN